MEISTSSFFNGVALAAGQSEFGSTASFKRDAKQLCKAFPAERIEIAGSDNATLAPIVAANRWLTFRSRIPTGKLQKGMVTIDAVEPQETNIVEMQMECLNRAADTFSDTKIAGVISGTIVGLQKLKLITPRELNRNWRTLGSEYERYLTTYNANGVPVEAANELFVREWLDRLAEATGFSLSFGEPRWGSLHVSTEPDAASIFVDEDSWGPSPTGMAVRAGEHDVFATKGKLQSKETVNVPAAHLTELSLNLA